METEPNYPLLFNPIFMERLWGGRRLESVLGKQLPDGKRIGESWEISDHAEQTSIVANGPLRGRSLRDLIANSPERILGPALCRGMRSWGAMMMFPLLVKWIDAREKLSIQVHPGDGHRRLAPGETGKTECWFIADADADAQLYVGLRRGIDRPALERELARATVERCLNAYPAHPGDFFFVPAGTPHSIGAGVLLAEIQQTSDTTFRLWDWDRKDPITGKPRSLHIEAALDSIDYCRDNPLVNTRPKAAEPACNRILLGPDQCSHFCVTHQSIDSVVSLGGSDCFHILVCISGAGTIGSSANEVRIARGNCVLLPASGPFSCRPNPRLELLDAWVPL